jgi:DNA-binding LytR/AlgR family response regulator
VESSFRCGLVTPFDAEILAAASGIEAAVDLIASEFTRESRTSPEWHVSTQYTRTLVLCIDNQAAAMGILAGLIKLGHAPAVCAATKIREFLDMHPKHKFITMWVPLHVKDMKFGGAAMPRSLAMRGNDRVDDLCTKRLADRGPIPSARSKAATIAALREKHLTSWRKELTNIKQRGQKCLLRKKDISRIRHSGTKHDLLGSAGNDTVLYSKLGRTVSNHAPTGDFMIRFKKEGHPYCLCDPTGNTLETRDHVLYHCPFWIREGIEYSRTGEPASWDLDSLETS